jgi:hypothetical protein
MEQKERTIVYGLVAACIAGIVLVGLLLFFVGGAMFSGEGFSEVSFLESQKIPTVIYEGNPLDFSFGIASHHNEKMDYKYNVIVGDTIVRNGTFSLPDNDKSQKDRYNKTISITNLKLKSTLTKVTNSTLTETQNTYNGRLGLLASHDGGGDQVISDPSYLYYPVQFPVGNDHGALIFNPKNTETFHTTQTSKTNIGNLREVAQSKSAVVINNLLISDTGYDLSKSEWTIQNNYGIINASSKTLTEKYRYGFEKISVEVEAYPVKDPDKITKYEIHFWTVVSEIPQEFDT